MADLQAHLTLERPGMPQRQMLDANWMISVPLKRHPGVGTYPNLPAKQYRAISTILMAAPLTVLHQDLNRFGYFLKAI